MAKRTAAKTTKKPRPTTRKQAGATGVTVGELTGVLNELSPFELAAEWDNVGLLAGHPDWSCQSVAVALDLTDAVADELLRKSVDTLVVYHPPIFKPLRRLTPKAEGPTRRLPELLAKGISIIALHTALDAAVGGTNDVLLDVFDPIERWPLEPIVRDHQNYKLVVFVPRHEVEHLREILSAQGAGVIGHYGECSFELEGHGTFKGDESTNPTVGQRGQLEYVSETRLEMIVSRRALSDVVRAIYRYHSYEEPAFDIYPLHEVGSRGGVGLGRVGRLAKPMRGTALLKQLGASVDLAGVRTVGALNRTFSTVTVAAGSFGVDAFRDPDSLVVTGEFKHHDAVALLKRGITAVHLGHDKSERPVLESVRRRLRARLKGVRVELVRADRSPFVTVKA